MAGWKKYLFVAMICMLVLGLMLYGDIGYSGSGGGGREIDYGTATVNDRIHQNVVELSSERVGDIVNLFNVTGIEAVANPQTRRNDNEVHVDDLVSSYLYYDNALTHEHYALAPSILNEWINNRVWMGREKLVDPKFPERAQMRSIRATELGATVHAIEEFVRIGGAGAAKQQQFIACLQQTSRSDLALLYLISRERARMRYLEFPARDYLEAAKTAVAADAEKLQKRYDEDKVKPRSHEGETGEGMSRPLKLQFDVFYILQDAFFAQEEAKLNETAVLAEYTKQRDAFLENAQDNPLLKDKAKAIFGDYKPHNPNVKPLVIRPEWETDKTFLPPEDVVLDYIKYQQMIPRALIGRSQTVIREFAKRYNGELPTVPPEQRAEFAVNYLERLKNADAAGYEAKWQFVRYLRTDLASFHAYATAPQIQLSAETKTPYALNTFFAQVHNQHMLPMLQKELSDPLTYHVATDKEGQPLLGIKAGGSLVFQIYAVENLDPAAALMPFDSPEAKELLIERLARVEAPKLAEKAAQETLDAWKADPTKIPTDPTVLKEFVEPESDPQQPITAPGDKRLVNLLNDFKYATPDSAPNAPPPEPVLAGQLRGPISCPLEQAASDADKSLNECYAIGFIAQFHQIKDPMARVTADAGWRGGNEPRMLQFSMLGSPRYGVPGLTTQMIHAAVFDAFSTTIDKPKTAEKE